MHTGTGLNQLPFDGRVEHLWLAVDGQRMGRGRATTAKVRAVRAVATRHTSTTHPINDNSSAQTRNAYTAVLRIVDLRWGLSTGESVMMEVVVSGKALGAARASTCANLVM